MIITPGGVEAATPSEVRRLLDDANHDEAAQNGAMLKLNKKELGSFLRQENAYEVLSQYIVSPAEMDVDDNANDAGENNDDDDESSKTVPGYTRLQRSFRSMHLLANDAHRAEDIQRQGGDLNNLPTHIKLVLNPTRAGLLAKTLFAAYRHAVAERRKRRGIGSIRGGGADDGGAHLLHVNRLMTALLDGYPNAVISAASAGGKGAIANTLGPMLALLDLGRSTEGYDRGNILKQREEEDRFIASSTLTVFAGIVVTGCTGRKVETGNPAQQQQQQFAQPRNVASLVTKGHRRKFVHSLVEFGIFAKLAEFVTHGVGGGAETPGNDDSVAAAAAVASSEMACDSIISIIDSIAFPPATLPGMPQQPPKSANADGENESIGEEILLQTLSDQALVKSLYRCAGDADHAMSISASKALLGIFELCTGRSKKKSAPPVEDATDEDEDQAQAAKNMKALEDAVSTEENKLRKSGATAKMHANLVSMMEMLVTGLGLYPLDGSEGPGGDESENGEEISAAMTTVRHPGRCVIAPFTLRRLQLIALLADILSFEETGAVSDPTKRYAAAIAAMDALMKLPLHPSVEKKKKGKNSEPNPADDVSPAGSETGSRIPLNPWPALCDLLFAYTENNMYQVHFFRLLQSACLTNHEDTLKLLVQKCKFVTRAIKECGSTVGGSGTTTSSSPDVEKSPPPSHRGVILRCLNALRLQCQASSPTSFLNHYLGSHDGWKGYQATLISVTIEHETLGGGIAVPTNTGIGPVITNDPSAPNDVSIDLGSSFAAELGFDSSVSKYVAPDPADISPKSGGETVNGGSGSGGGGGDESGGGGCGGSKPNTANKKKKKKKKKK